MKTSELGRLLRIAAWVKRYVHNSKPDSSKLNGIICAPEHKEALSFWMKTIQIKHYGTEYRCLKVKPGTHVISSLPLGRIREHPPIDKYVDARKDLDLYPGRDGNIRSLLIKTSKGNIRRSVQLVYNLEINA
ncbi:hypothetical protein NPIL_81971 [Nephila pilipes]|uniref:Uncharacterized protein n=1 Tax=Nephila pilipes TaxID=299642 RepID=A0A8X6NLV3_NEPPI|nr:hypothetical protein NPIL_81971 [Nephila pilipes]